MVEPLLMFAPPLVLELPVALDPVPVVLAAPPAAPPVPLLLVPLLIPLLVPLLVPLLMFDPLVLEPLLMLPVLSPDAGATAPLAVAVSVVLALLLLLHAVTAARAAAIIAMRFMKSSMEIIAVSGARHSARHFTRVVDCCGGNKRTPDPWMREGRNLSGCALRPSRAEVGYGFFPIFIDVSFFIVESVFVVVVVVDIALSCLVVSIIAGAGLMAGAATTAVSAGAESLALHAAIASTAATSARRFIETLLLEGGMGSTLRPSTSVVAMPGASGG